MEDISLSHPENTRVGGNKDIFTKICLHFGFKTIPSSISIIPLIPAYHFPVLLLWIQHYEADLHGRLSGRVHSFVQGLTACSE